jgi:hypothetical protein
MVGKKWLTGAAAAIGIVTFAGGIAFAASQQHPTTTDTGSAPSVADVISAFRTAPLTSASDIATKEDLKRQFNQGTDQGNPLGMADFSAARPVPIAGTQWQVWIAPSGNEVCTYIPDPVNGWGGSCSSLASVEAGDAYTILGGGSAAALGENVIVAVIVADGQEAPRIVDPNGANSPIAVHSNVAAALVPASSSLKLGTQSINLAATVHPTKVRWMP